MITQKRLKEVLKYDPDTGLFYWKVGSRRSQTKPGHVAGSDSNGYREICICQERYKAHRLAWLYVYGYMPENQIDHIDRDSKNNRINNLREVTQTCNNRNTGNHKNNTSGVKGVRLNHSHKNETWASSIGSSGKNIHLGYFVDFTEAVCMRLAAEQSLNWSGCDSSSPAYKYVKENIQCHI